MNKELKFRVWDNRDRRFRTSVEGAHYRDCYLHLSLNGGVVAFNIYGEELDLESDRFTIQQYTGLKDTKGKEIYEGDILEELVANETGKQIGVCKQVLGGWKIFTLNRSAYHGWKHVVVGNIFENPELLNQYD